MNQATADTATAGIGATELAKERQASLELLREPFDDAHISKRPQPNCSACKEARDKVCGKHRKEVCKDCGQWMSNGHIHLDYVGHAEITDRLLDADLEWFWEPVAWTPEGLPKLDPMNGLWIRLTVRGVTRLGYGDAVGKQMSTSAMKEIIGDALRNGAMRFGVGLDLWAKSDLHAPEPHKGEILAERLRLARGKPAELQQIKLDVEDQGQGGYLVPGADGRTLGQIVDDWIAELVKPSQSTTPAATVPPAVPAVSTPAAPEAPAAVDSVRQAALDEMLAAAAEANFSAELPGQFLKEYSHPIDFGTTAEFRQARDLMTGVST